MSHPNSNVVKLVLVALILFLLIFMIRSYWNGEVKSPTEQEFLKSLTVKASIDGENLTVFVRCEEHRPDLLFTHDDVLISPHGERSIGRGFGILGLTSTTQVVPLDSLDIVEWAGTVLRIRYAVHRKKLTDREGQQSAKPERGELLFEGTLDNRIEKYKS